MVHVRYIDQTISRKNRENKKEKKKERKFARTEKYMSQSNSNSFELLKKDTNWHSRFNMEILFSFFCNIRKI